MSDASRFLPPGQSAESMRELAFRFESLGGHWLGCEVGQIQRIWQAEPLGLLRWSEMTPESLIGALRGRFEGVGDPEHTEIFVQDGEYRTRDKRWLMAMHSFIKAESMAESAFASRALRRLKFLRQKLLDDLQAGERIVVAKFTDKMLDDEQLHAMHDAVRELGNSPLLYVRLADEGHPAGTVTRKDQTLFVGYIDRFAAGPNGENLGFNPIGWFQVFKNALAQSEKQSWVPCEMKLDDIQRIIDGTPSFTFSRGNGEVITESLSLLPNGRVYGPHSFNESSWQVEGESLLFLDSNGLVTTRFRLDVTDGVPQLRGRFSNDGRTESEVVHVLTPQTGEPIDGRWCDETSSRKPGTNRCAFLIRTHVLDDKTYDLFRRLAPLREKHDVFILMDGTNYEVTDDTNTLMWHSAKDFKDIGLTHEHNRLMWWCGDFPFYVARRKLPDHDYLVMIEYDVHVSETGVALLAEFANTLVRGTFGRVDAIGTRLRQETSPDDNLHRAAWHQFEAVYSYYFPIIILSKSAADFAYQLRKQEAKSDIPMADVLYCESFIPSALHASGFRCYDLNYFIPNFYRNDMMVARNRVGGLCIETATPLEKFSKILHPVYTTETLFSRSLGATGDPGGILRLKACLLNGDFGNPPPDLLARFLSALDKKLSALTAETGRAVA